MATVTGVFRIIDRATPAMKGMERQAYRTDAAIASVGASLDSLGSNQRLRRLSQATRSVRSLGNEAQGAGKQMEAAGRGANVASRGIDRAEKSAGRAHVAFRNLAQGLRDVAVLAKPGLFVALGAAIGIVVQAVGALAGGVVGLTPAIADLAGIVAPAGAGIVGLGLAMVTAKLAFKDFGQALGGNKDAFKRLTPEAKSFLSTLRQYRPVLKELRASAQRGLFPGLTDAVGKLAGGGGPEALRRLLGGTGRALGGVASTIAGRLTSAEALPDFERLGDQGNRMLRMIGGAFADLIDVFRNFSVAAIPFTDWMTRSITGWARHRRAISQFNRDSGKTAAFLDRTRSSMELMARVGRNLWETFRNLGRAARPLGDDLWAGIDKATRRWADYTGSVRGSVRLTQQFTAMGPAIKQIAGLFGDLGKAIFRMGSDPKLAGTVQELRGLVGPLERILTGLANTLGPPLTRALVALGETFTQLGGFGGPVVVFLDAITGILKGVNAIADAVPALKGVFGAALSVALIGRFLVKLGLLERGWWRVGTAARSAAVAEAEATALSRGGGLGGTAVGPLGRGAAGMSRWAKAGRIGGYGLLASLAAGPVTEGLTGSSRAGGVAGKAALGASIGATAGTIVPGVGTVLGGVAGGIAGGAFGLLSGAGRGEPGIAEVNRVQHEASSRLAGANGFGRRGLEREVAIFQAALGKLSGVQGEAAEAQRMAYRAEIDARQRVIAGLKQEATGRELAESGRRRRAAAVDLQRGFDFLLKRGASKGDALSAVNARAQLEMRGMRLQDRKEFARGLFTWEKRQIGGDKSLGPTLEALRGQLGPLLALGQRKPDAKNFPAGGLPAINRELTRWPEQMAQAAKSGMTQMQRFAYLTLVGQGADPAWARAQVFLAEANGTGVKPFRQAPNNRKMLGDRATPDRIGPDVGRGPGMREPDEPAPRQTARQLNDARNRAVRERNRRHAGGGRIAGRGLSDTVPVPGGMAAPGELIVNRHTEKRVDALLGGRSLEGMVAGENRRHSDRYATGGRAPKSLAGYLHDEYELAASTITNWTDLGTYNPASTLPGGGPSDHAHYPADAFDAGFSPPSGWGNESARAFFEKMVGRAGIHYAILGDKIWSTDKGLHAYGAGGHENHVHVSGSPGQAGSQTTARPKTGAAGGAGPASTGGAAALGPPAGIGISRARADAARAIMGFGGPSRGGVGPAGAATAGTVGKPAATTSTPVGSDPKSGTRALGKRMMLERGFGADQWGALETLWDHESNWNPAAHNPRSGAHGIPQALPGSKMSSSGPDWYTNAETQIDWGLGYIKGRYGTPGAAWKFWQNPTNSPAGASAHWYGRGGRMPSFAGWHAKGGEFETKGPTFFGAGERGKERVKITPMSTSTAATPMPTKIEVHVHGGGGGDDVYEMARAGAAAALEDFADRLDREGE